MSNIKSTNSSYVRYVLQSSKMFSSRIMEKNPGNWETDNMQLDRHKDYHGIFFTFHEGLEFYGDDMDYILNAFDGGDLNTNLRLRRDVLKRDEGGDIKWVVTYIAIADFKTLNINDGVLSINFTSNNLAEIIKSHESDKFEIEREESIDGKDFTDTPFNKNIVDLKGRDIIQSGQSNVESNSFPLIVIFGEVINSVLLSVGSKYSTITKIISRGPVRHSSVDTFLVGDVDEKATNMFFVDQTAVYDPNLDTANVTVDYDLSFNLQGEANVQFEKFKWNDGLGEWELQSTHPLGTYTSVNLTNFTIKETNTFLDVGFDEGIMLVFEPTVNNTRLRVLKHLLTVSEITTFFPSTNISFGFVHDVASRLMYILTGRENAFYSKFYGRTEILDKEGKQQYANDGEGGLIGLISGLWVRDFDPVTDKYKSLTISVKDLITSLKAVNNIGISIESIDYNERLRFEELAYFYRDRVIVKFPLQMSNVKRKVDPSLFFSGLEFGYEKGGDYENEIGLDEPNTRTSWVSPIRKSSLKFSKFSKVRSDEYPMEIARRKPQLSHPDEDTRYDDSNWFLDLKRSGDEVTYSQNEPLDILETLPLNVHSPETYRSAYFTPLRMLFRHAWVFGAGLRNYLGDKIRYISSKSNSKLITHFIDEDNPHTENEDIDIEGLDRAKLAPWIITAEYPLDDDLMDWILDSTEVEDENGEKEMVPNYYFKMQILNEKGKLEEVYLLNLKPGDIGKFTFQKANENIL